MSNIRWSRDRLIFNMKIPIPWEDGLYIESEPCLSSYIHVYLSVGCGCISRSNIPSNGAAPNWIVILSKETITGLGCHRCQR